MKYYQWIKKAENYLCNSEDPFMESLILLKNVINKSYAHIITFQEEKLKKKNFK